jgi:hypothetical protein
VADGFRVSFNAVHATNEYPNIPDILSVCVEGVYPMKLRASAPIPASFVALPAPPSDLINYGYAHTKAWRSGECLLKPASLFSYDSLYSEATYKAPDDFKRTDLLPEPLPSASIDLDPARTSSTTSSISSDHDLCVPTPSANAICDEIARVRSTFLQAQEPRRLQHSSISAGVDLSSILSILGNPLSSSSSTTLLQNSVEQLDANLSSALDMNASIRTYDEESRLAIGGHLALLIEELQFHCDRSRLLLITRLSSDLKRRIEGQRLMNDNVSRNYSTISTALALSRDMKMLIIDLREVLRDPSNLFIRSGVQSALMAASAWMTSQDSMASFSAASTVAATSSLLKYANGRRVDADAPLPGYGTAPSSADINLHLRPSRFGKRYSSDY